jgi:hypothetical protein
MKVYTKEKKSKLSATWLVFDGDKRERFPNVRQGV